MNAFRKISLGIGLAAAALAILYSALWGIEAAQVRGRVERFIAARAATGMQISYQSLGIGGFPLRLSAHFTGLSLAGLPHIPSAVGQTPELLAWARPWQPNAWTVTARHGVALHLPRADGGQTSLRFDSLKGVTKAAAPPNAGLEIAISSSGLALDTALGTSVAAGGKLRLVLPDRPPTDHMGEALGFVVNLDKITLPVSLPPLGDTIQQVEIDGGVEGPVPEQPLRAALAAWRDEGGTIELRHVALDCGRVHFDGDGTLAFDAALQPVGAFSANILGWEDILAGLVAQNRLNAHEASYIRLGLGLLAHKTPDGRSALKAPVTVQNGKFYLGPAALAPLPLIDWD